MMTYHFTAYSLDNYEFYVGNHATAEERDAQLRAEIESEIERLDLETPFALSSPRAPSAQKLLDWYNEQDLDGCWHFSSYDFDPTKGAAVHGGLIHAAHGG